MARLQKGVITWDIAFSPNGMILASGIDDGTVRLWDAITGHPITVLKAHRSWENTRFKQCDIQ